MAMRVSAGQSVLEDAQTSAASHGSALALHTWPAKLTPAEQQAEVVG